MRLPIDRYKNDIEIGSKVAFIWIDEIYLGKVVNILSRWRGLYTMIDPIFAGIVYIQCPDVVGYTADHVF